MACRRSLFAAGLSFLLSFVCPALGSAQQAPAAAQQTQTPPGPHPQLNAYRQANALKLMDDYGQLARYRAANNALPPPGAGQDRVIFFGDSITDAWNLDQYFPGKGYINRGISGQTTSQMLVRFRQDVIDLQPHVVLILAGTNDIAGNTGPISLEDIERNYASMAELARVHHIVVIFESVTPVNGDFAEKREYFTTRPISEILALDAWLKNYCAANGDLYVDYYPAMVDERGEMRQGLSLDGLHPNDAGYKIMAPLAQNAIDRALKM